MRIKHVRVARYIIISALLTTSLVIYNINYLEFLIAKNWYYWVTSYSTNVVEVSVIEDSIAQDLTENEIGILGKELHKGYLGYAFFITIVSLGYL